MRRPSTDKRHFIIAGVLIVIVAAALYWLLYNALPLPLQGSTQATTIDWLFQAHMILLSVLFALVVVFMVYAIVVFRKRGDDDDEGEHFEGNSTLEIAWTVIPLILVVVFSYIGVTTLRDVLAESPDELAVNVTGRQWSWSFAYPDTGVEAAELVLPVNRPVRLDMEAQDVLHAFWVPEFRVKKDLVPGQITDPALYAHSRGRVHRGVRRDLRPEPLQHGDAGARGLRGGISGVDGRDDGCAGACPRHRTAAGNGIGQLGGMA